MYNVYTEYILKFGLSPSKKVGFNCIKENT